MFYDDTKQKRDIYTLRRLTFLYNRVKCSRETKGKEFKAKTRSHLSPWVSCHCTHATKSILIKFKLLKVVGNPMVIAARHRSRIRTNNRRKCRCRMMMNRFDVMMMMVMICTGTCCRQRCTRRRCRRTCVIVCRC